MKILMAEHRYGNTESRAIGATLAGCEVCWVEPYWAEGLGRLRKGIQFKVRNGPDIARWNKKIIETSASFKPDAVWVESPLFIYPETLEFVKKRYGSTIVCAYSDDPRDPNKRSRFFDNAKHLFDLIFLTKDELAQAFLSEGVNAVGKFWKGFDPIRIKPTRINAIQKTNRELNVVFIGHADYVNGKSARQNIFERVADRFDNFILYGKSWGTVKVSEKLRSKIQPFQLDGDEYPKVISNSAIALQIPSRLARDTHSSRSIEIPACGTLMIAERTTDHLMLFEEDKEAVFFSSVDELLEKIGFYLEREDERKRIAAAGYRRCIAGGYSNYDRMREMLKLVDTVRGRHWVIGKR